MEKEKTQGEGVSKLMIDKPSDFVFHAAYMAYSKTWDETPSEEDRTKLNEIMLSFSEGKGDQSSFYGQLSQFRKDFNSDFRARSRIRSERKSDWRKREQKRARMSRHRR